MLTNIKNQECILSNFKWSAITEKPRTLDSSVLGNFVTSLTGNPQTGVLFAIIALSSFEVILYVVLTRKPKRLVIPCLCKCFFKYIHLLEFQIDTV